MGYQGLKAEDKEKPQPTRMEIPTWQTQMRSYLYYPEVLLRSNWEGTIVLSFQLDTDNCVSQVQVLTPDQKLNAKLTNQLLGKKLMDKSLDP